MKGTVLEGAHPMELFGRIVLLDQLRQIGAKKISMLVEDQRANFIVKRLNDLDEHSETQWEIDYEYAIFVATDKDFEKLLSNFRKSPQMSEAQKKLILDKNGN